MKSCSKDKSCAGSPSVKGKCSRMAPALEADGGKGVATDSLSAEAWGWAGEWKEVQKAGECGNFYHC